MSVVTVGGLGANLLKKTKRTASRMACGDDRCNDLEDLANLRGRDLRELSEEDWQNQRMKIKNKGGMCETPRLNGLEKMYKKGINPSPQELRAEEQRIRKGGSDEPLYRR
jgi:hypothetical protein